MQNLFEKSICGLKLNVGLTRQARYKKRRSLLLPLPKSMNEGLLRWCFGLSLLDSSEVEVCFIEDLMAELTPEIIRFAIIYSIIMYLQIPNSHQKCGHPIV